MFSQYFGQYLLKEKYLTAVQLKTAVEYQQSVRLKLGVLAINAGYMNADQASKVHSMQAKLDRRFGEIAVDMEYLKEEQVDELLSSQRFGHLLLAQALIDKNYMSLEKFEEAIYSYKKKYNISEAQFDKFRFIDSEVYTNKITKVNEFKTECAVSQRIKNSINLLTYINAKEDVFALIASRYAQEELLVVDEMAKDSVGEFLNLNNGLYLVGMSNIGIELDMEPQTEFFGKTIYSTYVIPIQLPFGTMELIISHL